MKMFAAVMALVIACAPLSAQEHLQIRFLDVGQADAVLVQHKGQTLLYDAGDRGTIVARRLAELGIDTIHVLMASHPHADHIGGMANVVNSVVVLRYIDTGATHTTVSYRSLEESLVNRGVYSIHMDDIDYFYIGEALAHLLKPNFDVDNGLNNQSIGVRIDLGEGSLMMAGDAEPPLWNYWTTHIPYLLRPVTVHKSSHHGSRNGDTMAAMRLLSPATTVIQTGQNNRYGHPHPQALRIYDDIGSRVFRTDIDGEVVVEIYNNGTYRVWTEAK